MALGPVPWTAIALWCDHNELDADASQLVTHVIQFLDGQVSARAQRERDLEAIGNKKGHAR